MQNLFPKKTLLFALAAAIVLLQFCTKSDENNNPVPPAPPAPISSDVILVGNYSYAAGNISDSTIAYYWRNNITTKLSRNIRFTFAHGVTVSGNDVYVVGDTANFNTETTAVYWKNGQLVILGKTGSSAKGIAVSGNDIYIVGFARDSLGNRRAAYWKNGVQSFLSMPNNSSSTSNALAVFALGNDVYISGYYQSVNGAQQAGYWKNNMFTSLPGILSSLDSYAWSIYVSGSDVHVAGNVIGAGNVNMGAYWKNGTLSLLDSTKAANARGIVVSGNDVHIIGTSSRQTGATHWKNGVVVPLGNVAGPPSSHESQGFCIAVSGSDVYTAGINNSIATFWKNGVETKIPSARLVYGIVVVP